MSRYKTMNDSAFVDLEHFNDEVDEGVGFALVCNNCGQRKTIVFSPNEIYDYNNDIDVSTKEIYCAGCHNSIKSKGEN